MRILRELKEDAPKIFEWLVRFLPYYPTQVWKGRKGLEALNRDDCEVALEHWRPLASEGDAEANYQLGLLYAAGRCVDQDMTKASELMKEAVLWGHRGAKRWFKQQARAGNANAQYMLAMMTLGGHVNLSIWSRHLSILQAEKLLETALDRGQPDAGAVLAMWHFGGFEPERGRFTRFFLNRRWSARLFFKLPPMNHAKAMSLLEQSVRLGSLPGMTCLADFYEKGFDLPPNPAKAFHLMMEAAQRGDAYAQLGLARYYWEGVGTEVDREQARRWFDTAKAKMTKDLGCDAHRDLVARLMEGVGCEPDLVQAYYWAQVTERRFPGEVAHSHMSKLRKKMTKEQVQEAERLLANDDLAA